MKKAILTIAILVFSGSGVYLLANKLNAAEEQNIQRSNHGDNEHDNMPTSIPVMDISSIKKEYIEDCLETSGGQYKPYDQCVHHSVFFSTKKEDIEECLENSRSQYKLYNSCIGKLTSECTENYKKYSTTLKANKLTGKGSYFLTCTDFEAGLWDEIYKEKKGKLINTVSNAFKRSEVIESLNQSFLNIEELRKSCDYAVVRWDFDDIWERRKRYVDDFTCSRNSTAERAIKVYLWEKNLKERLKYRDKL